jgi:hypothetical protein
MRERADKYIYRRRASAAAAAAAPCFCCCVCLCIDGGRCSDFWIRLCGGPQPGAAATAAVAAVAVAARFHGRRPPLRIQGGRSAAESLYCKFLQY